MANRHYHRHMPTKVPPPSQTADKYIVRLPDGMREQIAEAAKANGRSMNAEIVSRLERSMSEAPAINGLSLAELFKKLDSLEKSIKSGEFVPRPKTPARRKGL